MPDRGQVLEIGKGRILAEGSHVAFLSFGAHLSEVRLAAEALAARGITATIADARFAKPLDHALIDQLVRHHAAVITVEQGAQGGFGAQVLHYLAASGQLQTGAALRCMTLVDKFIEQASPEVMYAQAGLSARDIAATALRALGLDAFPAQTAQTLRA